jgi:hypothetical protein
MRQPVRAPPEAALAVAIAGGLAPLSGAPWGPLVIAGGGAALLALAAR